MTSMAGGHEEYYLNIYVKSFVKSVYAQVWMLVHIQFTEFSTNINIIASQRYTLYSIVELLQKSVEGEIP